VNFFKKIFYKINYSRKLSGVKKLKKNVKGFDRAKSFGILFDGTSDKDVKLIKNYVSNLKSKGKTVEMLGYINSKNTNETAHYFFSNEDLNWYSVPTSKQVEDFINKDFDIFMGLHTKSYEPLDYITALSKADFKIGMYRKAHDEFYDLMVEGSQTKKMDNLSTLIDQVDHYVKIINN